jgi:predicted HAD superfamily Cof-like phosphohydrolase
MPSDPHIIQHIFEFNEKIVGVVADEINPLTIEQFEWTVKAYREEVAELIEAYEKQDVVAMVDANIDLIYFAVGTLRKMGLTAEQALECFHAVHSANMTKVRGGKATRGNFEEDAVKSPEFVPPEQVIMSILMEKPL